MIQQINPENKVLVSASVLNSDLSRLGEMCRNADNAGADMLHIDVMDGSFVENISYGSPVQAAIKPLTARTIDTHLMVIHPLPLVKFFAKAGSDIITFHVESQDNPEAVIDEIHAHGLAAGISVKPKTPIEAILPLLGKVELVLIMTVEPGYGGQGFIPETLGKISALRAEITRLGLKTSIEVDGGINAETAKLVREKGADVLVAGTYLFKAEDMAAAVGALRR